MAIGQLIMELFHARTTAHVLHLKTRNYSEHVALSVFYDEVVDLADQLAEAYQGGYELIKEFPSKYTPYSNALLMLDDLRETVDECVNSGEWDTEDTHLNNICDEVRQLIASTQYKLRFLS